MRSKWVKPSDAFSTGPASRLSWRRGSRKFGCSESQPPDVVVTDMIMPKTNGNRAHQDFAGVIPRVRVIAISGRRQSIGLHSLQARANQTHAYLAAAREAGAEEILTETLST